MFNISNTLGAFINAVLSTLKIVCGNIIFDNEMQFSNVYLLIDVILLLLRLINYKLLQLLKHESPIYYIDEGIVIEDNDIKFLKAPLFNYKQPSLLIILLILDKLLQFPSSHNAFISFNALILEKSKYLAYSSLNCSNASISIIVVDGNIVLELKHKYNTI